MKKSPLTGRGGEGGAASHEENLRLSDKTTRAPARTRCFVRIAARHTRIRRRRGEYLSLNVHTRSGPLAPSKARVTGSSSHVEAHARSQSLDRALTRPSAPANGSPTIERCAVASPASPLSPNVARQGERKAVAGAPRTAERVRHAADARIRARFTSYALAVLPRARVYGAA